MDREDRTTRSETQGGPANTPPFDAEPDAVRSAADHQISEQTGGMNAPGQGQSETEQELERTRDLIAERAAPVVVEKTQEAIKEAADRTMHDPEVKDQLKRTAKAAQHDVQRAAQERIGGIAARAETRINEGMQQAADRLEDAAERLDRLADESMAEPSGVRARAGSMAHDVADTVESVARYLRDQDARGLQSDLERQIRERPVQMLLVGIATGWIAGKILR
jgi:hypothetical protein